MAVIAAYQKSILPEVTTMEFNRKTVILAAVAAFFLTVFIAEIVYCLYWVVSYHDSTLLKAISSQPFLPFEQVYFYWGNAIVRKAAATALLIAALIAAMITLLLFRRKKEPLGNAAFQTVSEISSGKFFRKKGHIFGKAGNRIIRALDDGHHLVIGPTRSGKGVGYVITNALMHVGSMIVTDLKGEVWNATAGYRVSQGNRVFRFAPGQDFSHRYNPLDFVRPDIGDRTTDIQNIALTLIPEKGGDGAIWSQLAQQIAAALISYILESDRFEGRRNLGELNNLINSGQSLQEKMENILRRERDLSKFTIQGFNQFIQMPEKTAGSALTDLQAALNPWKNEKIAASTAMTDHAFKDAIYNLKKQPSSIYITPNVSDMTLLRPLMALFVQQIMNILLLKHEQKALTTFFLLDEFRQLGKMQQLMTSLPYVAGYNIKFAFVIQDLKGVDGIYGEHERTSMLANCRYQMVLGANDNVTAEFVSKALGQVTVRYNSRSQSGGFGGIGGYSRTTLNETIRDRALMMPQEIRQMPQKQMLLLIEGQKPIKCQKLRFYETNPFKEAEAYAQQHVPMVPSVFIGAFGSSPNLQRVLDEADSRDDEQEDQGRDEDEDQNVEEENTVEQPAERNQFVDQLSLLEMKAQEANDRLNQRIQALEKAINEAARKAPRKVRPEIEDLFNATVPDPETAT
ncbi:type IV secretory system conjugative DNA transfer family protein [Allorhizobium sp. BGMRC 0089]|uniref:type IV secretory system conjugative DNA transfer family protein n=1 Tax=Allorhizobium sonneratiae TaxID=2934936 RepID=UPI002033F95D|nr:type IV secretory system conjugative DNA transfer family protein [Allorhizobium sonneratiae]MCM2294713.1 type IV secretory system conjugative DNA transfer family protein [Allorhizobium sonneratiae]